MDGDLVEVSDPRLAALGESCVGGEDERLSFDASDALDADLRGLLDDIGQGKVEVGAGSSVEARD